VAYARLGVPMLELRVVRDVTGRVVVSARGEVDLAVSAELADAVHATLDAYRGSRRIVLDLDGLAFIDCSGVRALIVAEEAARARGAVLVVERAQGIVAKVLRLTGVAELLGLPVVAAQPGAMSAAAADPAPGQQ
jgi:anti-sigma B factor antagonist